MKCSYQEKLQMTNIKTNGIWVYIKRANFEQECIDAKEKNEPIVWTGDTMVWLVKFEERAQEKREIYGFYGHN